MTGQSSSASTTDPVPRPGFRSRVRAGELLLGVFAQTGSSLVAEILGRAGLDWVLLDLEHGAGSEAALVPQLQALGLTGTPGMVRVESHERIRIGRALDLGADAIMAARVDSADQAREVARHLRYPPVGDRGVAGVRRYGFLPSNPEMLERVDADVVGIVQIESEAAVAGVEAIAAVDGIDVLFLGPTDLSQDMGILGQLDDPRFLAARRRVSEAAKASGKTLGAFLPRIDALGPWMEEGYTVFAVGADTGMLSGAARAAVAATRELQLGSS